MAISQDNAAGAPDDFIPAPEGSTSLPTPNESAADAEVPALPLDPISEAAGLGQTELILAVVAVVIVAGLLLFLRGAVRRSLIAGRAPIDSANAAAWAWYFVLLLFVVLVVAGVIGNLFESIPFIVIMAVVLIVGIGIAAKMTSRARASG